MADTFETADRVGVTPAVHLVLDCLEDLREGVFSRAPVDSILAEIDLIGDTVFALALRDGPADESGDDCRARLAAQGAAALALPATVRMAAMLLLGIERAAAQTAAISAGAQGLAS